MRRRNFLTLMGAVVGWPHLLAAQPRGKIATVGLLSPFIDAESSFLPDLRGGLQELGYVEGRNIKIEYLSSEGKVELLPELVSELLRRGADVIVTSSVPAVRAARGATRQVPIVFARVGDAVNQGIVASLGRPGGNATGISWFAPELSGKTLDILKEAVADIKHVAILREAAAGAASAIEAQSAAQRVGLSSQLFQARTFEELDTAFAAIKSSGADSVVVLEGVMIFNNAKKIARLAADSKLPAIFFDSAFVNAGGLISYGPNFSEMHRRAAYFIDRILRGANPADLPVEQPTKFDLAINVATAKSMGLQIASSLLLRADRIIE
jgi:putative ABC transport system substrate-binding protein